MEIFLFPETKKGQKNNGNFICVFECTIVNLATYRQFTNAAWDWIIKKKKLKQKQNKSRKKKSKLHKVWAIPVPISTTKDVIYVALMAIFIIFLII